MGSRIAGGPDDRAREDIRWNVTPQHSHPALHPQPHVDHQIAQLVFCLARAWSNIAAPVAAPAASPGFPWVDIGNRAACFPCDLRNGAAISTVAAPTMTKVSCRSRSNALCASARSKPAVATANSVASSSVLRPAHIAPTRWPNKDALPVHDHMS